MKERVVHFNSVWSCVEAEQSTEAWWPPGPPDQLTGLVNRWRSSEHSQIRQLLEGTTRAKSPMCAGWGCPKGATGFHQGANGLPPPSSSTHPAGFGQLSPFTFLAQSLPPAFSVMAKKQMPDNWSRKPAAVSTTSWLYRPSRAASPFPPLLPLHFLFVMGGRGPETSLVPWGRGLGS